MTGVLHEPTRRRTVIAVLAVAAIALAPIEGRAGEGKWTCEATLYGLAAGMSGDVTVRGVDTDIDVGFDTILENLEFGAMGSFTASRDRWGVTADLIYMGLGATKEDATAEFDQWAFEPTVSFRLHPALAVLGGLRYNSLSGETNGPLGRNPTGAQEWVDPILGAHARLPIAGDVLDLHMRADIGGFGVGSDLSWQLFPYLTCRVAGWASVQAGYRWIYNDYKSGTGRDEFHYDVLCQGPQLGFTFRF